MCVEISEDGIKFLYIIKLRLQNIWEALLLYMFLEPHQSIRTSRCPIKISNRDRHVYLIVNIMGMCVVWLVLHVPIVWPASDTITHGNSMQL